MIIINFLFSFGILFFLSISSLYNINTVFEYKTKKVIFSVFLFTFYIAIGSFLVLNNYISIIQYCTILLVLCLFSYMIFDKTIITTIIFILKSYFFYILSFLFIICLFEIIFRENIYLLLDSLNIYLIIVLSISIFLICEFYLIKYISSDFVDYIRCNIKDYIFIFIFAILIFKNYSLFYITINSKHSYGVTLLLFLSIINELFFTGLIFILMIKSYHFSIYKYKIKMINMKYKLQLKNYKELEKSQDKLKQISHDVNNHNIILHNLILNKKYNQALDYLSDYSSNIDSSSTAVFSNHKILNAILVNKYNVCKNKNIDLNIDINVPSNISISDFDLCILVSNLVDNAIDACSKLDSNKYIKIKSKIINNNFSFKILNTYNGSISIDNGNFLTLKIDKFNHGIGISSIKSVVKKNKGNYHFDFSENNFCAIITIPLL